MADYERGTPKGRVIVAEVVTETGPYGFIPVVIAGNHPRFVTGTRFDRGFQSIAEGEGYHVVILPYAPELV